MPGIPKSTACQHCKRKRIKCDQNWPACGQCLRSKLACPGPTSLSKFVYNGDHRVPPQTEQGIQLESLETQSLQPQVKVGKLIQRGQPSNHRNGISMSVMRLQVPRANPPTTSAERLGIKLNGLLKDGLDNGVCRQMSYLPHLRQRLGSSTCLRDCTALFCSAWINYRRRVPAETLISPNLFGKALRSLGKAVKEDQACTAETLGAMALLERTETLFGVGRVKHLDKHFNGIKHVMQRKGQPKMDDLLDVTLTFENQGVLFSLSLVGDSNYMMKENWEEITEKVNREKQEQAPCGQECFPDDFGVVEEGIHKWPDWVHQTKLIRGNPYGMEEEKDELLCTLHKFDEKVEAVMYRVTEKATSLGFLREVPDAELFTLGKYEFGSLFFAQMFAATLLIQMVIRRFIYDIGIIYGTPDETVYSRYRGVCVQLWMIFPYISTQDPLSAMELLASVYPSIEAADEYERNCFLEAILSVDGYQKRLPKDKSLLEASLRNMTETRFGRSSSTNL